MVGVFEERVATKVLDQFALLPERSKPRIFPNGTREWTPISGVVLARGPLLQAPCLNMTDQKLDRETPNEQLTCVSIGLVKQGLPGNVIDSLG